MKLFLIFRQGVYRHDLLGVYTDPDDAENVAMEAIKLEGDDYHTIEVLSADLNTKLNDDAELLYFFQKDNNNNITKKLPLPPENFFCTKKNREKFKKYKWKK